MSIANREARLNFRKTLKRFGIIKQTPGALDMDILDEVMIQAYSNFGKVAEAQMYVSPIIHEEFKGLLKTLDNDTNV